MSNYFRITAYHPTENISVIIDSNGKFEKLWQFSSYLVQKGFNILEVGDDTKFLDINTSHIEKNCDKLFLRAIAYNKSVYTTQIINDKSYKTIRIADKTYLLNVLDS